MVAIVTNLCDPCRADDKEVTATMQRELADNGKAYALDLCNHHYQEWYAPFVELVYEYGIPAKDSGKPRGEAATSRKETGHELQCEVCGRGYDKKPSLIHHQLDKHPGHPKLDHEQCKVCGEWRSRVGMSNHVAQMHPETKHKQEKISA